MKKLFMLVAAMAVLALSGVAVAGGKKEAKAKFDAEISLSVNTGPYDPYDPYYEEAVFSGEVNATPTNDRAEKLGVGVCEKKRTVIIRNVDEPKSSAYAVVRTDSNGNYTADATKAANSAGNYQARVMKKIKVAANIKCKGDKSNVVELTGP